MIADFKTSSYLWITTKTTDFLENLGIVEQLNWLCKYFYNIFLLMRGTNNFDNFPISNYIQSYQYQNNRIALVWIKENIFDNLNLLIRVTRYYILSEMLFQNYYLLIFLE